MCSGVGRSGLPMPRSTMSAPELRAAALSSFRRTGWPGGVQPSQASLFAGSKARKTMESEAVCDSIESQTALLRDLALGGGFVRGGRVAQLALDGLLLGRAQDGDRRVLR